MQMISTLQIMILHSKKAGSLNVGFRMVNVQKTNPDESR